MGPSARYGLYVERGTRPHWPPRAPLEGWARRHGVPVFVVQRAIARKGTRARPFLLPAFLQERRAPSCASSPPPAPAPWPPWARAEGAAG